MTPNWRLFHAKNFLNIERLSSSCAGKALALVPTDCIDPTVVGSQVCLGIRSRWAACACTAALADGMLV